MRKLSNEFLESLKTGFLACITDSVKRDTDLVLDIRDGYINIYYKGNSLLKLKRTGSNRYKAEIHEKFLIGVDINLDITPDTVFQFINAIPLLKQNIIDLGKRSLEIEYEQLIVRANNNEPRNNSEYFIVDRQYAVAENRFDLTGIFWERGRRRKEDEVQICLMEIKFSLNSDIKEVHNQIKRYYKAVKPLAAKISVEMEEIFQQKLELGLYQQPESRLATMKSLKFSRDIDDFQFIVIFVDYNPNSKLLDLSKLATLPFADQIKVFYTGFAMWQQNVTLINECSEHIM